MKQLSNNYAIVLYELNIPEQAIKETKEIFDGTPRLLKELTSPVNKKQVKHAVIDQVFPKEMHNFLKVVSDYQSLSYIDEIITAYESYKLSMEGVVAATVYYVTAPGDEQLEGIKSFIKSTYKKDDVQITLVEDKTLIGGFVLRVGEFEYDYSLKGKLTSYVKN